MMCITGFILSTVTAGSRRKSFLKKNNILGTLTDFIYYSNKPDKQTRIFGKRTRMTMFFFLAKNNYCECS